MKNINSLSKGYKKSIPNIRNKKTTKPLQPKKVNVEEIYNKIKMLYVDGNLTTVEINTIIKELQKLV
tara:strand:- start:443 stop:643 length:201 start_codon:yes stop_codon:yes gene_type:complete